MEDTADWLPSLCKVGLSAVSSTSLLTLLHFLPLHPLASLIKYTSFAEHPHLYTYIRTHCASQKAPAIITCFSNLETNCINCPGIDLDTPLDINYRWRNLQISTSFPLPSSRRLPPLLYTFKYAVTHRGHSEVSLKRLEDLRVATFSFHE
jgi:hypothetical protein